MSNSNPKDKQNSGKQEKPVEKKTSTTPPVPERPKANVTRAQKSVDVEDLKKKGNSNGEGN